MVGLVLDPVSSWLLVIAVVVGACMVGLALGRIPKSPVVETPASPGGQRRRDWLLEQVDDPDLPHEIRVALNEELRQTTAPFDWLHDDLREASGK